MNTERGYDVKPALHYIDGSFVEASDGAQLDVINPATEAKVSYVVRGTAEDANRAVVAAKESFDSGIWARAKPSHRREVLFRIADLMEKRSHDIAYVETLETGGPLGDTGADVNPWVKRAAWNFRFFGQEQELAGNESFNHNDELLTYTMTDPRGVFALISPWNGPFMMSTWKIAPCLAYGNSAVHKPSELAPLCIRLLAEIFEEAGLPKGVYNMLQGVGSEVGPALVEHNYVSGISFTGSAATAKDISQRVAGTMKRTSFELGGKSANIIFADANLEKAIANAAATAMRGSGQSCIAGTRILVEESIYDDFLPRFETATKAFRMGDPFDPATTHGPLISANQLKRVQGYVDLARSEGRILFGGGRPEGCEKGYFIEPTAIVDAPNSARVNQEEIFGPVVAIIPFRDADHALELANDSDYGLAGYVWTESQTTAHYMSHRMESAMIWINCGFSRDLRQPFGGMKGSGEGREGGKYSKEFFTETRFTSFPLMPR